MTNLTEKMAEFCENIKFEKLPNEVIKRVKLLILDTVGIIIRARHDAESTESLISAVNRLDLNNGNCHVFSDKNSYVPSAAALINGTLAHSLDFDDTHAEASLHSSAPILAAAFAAAQMKNCSGQELIAACVLGYEIQIRLGLAGGASDHYKRGFHPTATCGVFGATAAAGYIIGLSKQQFISAFGIALSQSSGSMQFLNDGSWTKRSHVGQAAQNGLSCAILASEGFKGPIEAFEGKWGYLNSFVSGGDASKALTGLGKKFETLNLGVKPYPSCRYSHAAMGALAEVRSKHQITHEEVKSVEVGLPHTGWRIIGETDDVKRRPVGAVDGQFSMPFCGAVVLRQGTMGWDDYAKHLNDASTLELAGKFTTVTDAWAESEYPANMAGIVRVKTERGNFEEKVSVPKGEPSNFMTSIEAREKFDDLVSPYLQKNQLDELVDVLLTLDKENSIIAMLDLTRSQDSTLRMAGED